LKAFRCTTNQILPKDWQYSGRVATFERECTEQRRNQKEHIERISSNRIPEKILKYEPKEKRSLSRSLRQ
jgi:acetyl/propionyl-CoA carboxylase alpha subunit